MVDASNQEPVKKNAAWCLECDTVIESKFRHDFQECKCKALFVDGGRDYQRIGWTPHKKFKIWSEGEDW